MDMVLYDTLTTVLACTTHGVPHCIYWYHRYMDSRYTIISCSPITVTHDTCIACSWLTVLCIHWYTCIVCCYILVIEITVHIAWILIACIFMYSRYMNISRYTDIDILVTGHESCWYAICGIPHILFPFLVILFPFPVILFYAINRAQVLLSWCLYHVRYLCLLHCVL